MVRQLRDKTLAEDLLQDVFLKALRQGEQFCRIDNAKAWLFEVARNTLADHLRRKHETIELPTDLCVEDELPPPVDGLANCLPRVLSELSKEDREAITCCDLEGMSQSDFARRFAPVFVSRHSSPAPARSVSTNRGKSAASNHARR
jgi:RNA polymerase sigma-70 factor (ECF subfamily)